MARVSKAALWSALLYNLAFPPVYAWPLVFFALVPWLLALYESEKKEAIKSGFVFGGLTYLFQMHFIAHLIERWTGNTVVAQIVWLLCGVGGGVYFVSFAWAAWAAMQKNWLWFVPLLWLGLELARGYLPIVAFPWAYVAEPLIHYPAMAALGRWVTIFGVGVWVMAVNCLFVKVFQGEPLKEYRGWALGALAGLLATIGANFAPIVKSNSHVAVLQIGTDIAFESPETRPTKIATAANPLIEQAVTAKADWILLPEGLGVFGQGMAMPFLLPEVPIIFGCQRRDPSRQSAALFSGRGGFTFADKTRLVVFGEYDPFRSILPSLGKAFGLGGDLVPGERPTTLSVGDENIGPLICFEALYPDIALAQKKGGANALAVLSMDDWFDGTNAVEQLRDAALWRALETGLPTYRSAPLGYSLISDGRGKVLKQADYGKPQMLLSNR